MRRICRQIMTWRVIRTGRQIGSGMTYMIYGLGYIVWHAVFVCFYGVGFARQET